MTAERHLLRRHRGDPRHRLAASTSPSSPRPLAKRYVFAYTVKIPNEGLEPAQLRTRHWIITDGNGKVEEVRGPGVVGQQPYLKPGEDFEYTSGCVLQTSRGEMRGTYQMHRPDGRFDATSRRSCWAAGTVVLRSRRLLRAAKDSLRRATSSSWPRVRPRRAPCGPCAATWRV